MFICLCLVSESPRAGSTDMSSMIIYHQSLPPNCFGPLEKHSVPQGSNGQQMKMSDMCEMSSDGQETRKMNMYHAVRDAMRFEISWNGFKNMSDVVALT